MGFKYQSIPVFTDSSTSLSQGKREGNAWSEGCKQYEIELSRAHSMRTSEGAAKTASRASESYTTTSKLRNKPS
ncbi:predicted protein [Ostreococcus lucimarinus CCE9901]|uniref:Uncharacterized protein n=1 Tax=Ostreococcus lucimarinus (strain CCE9901) TaxID=436017 RepID=A4SA69_OSTLU|nr:predicted protein [Ostreococcus lucimarinus CCE9901]ABP00645.1 predicted protein [Ostreococcus lucimarinus CCE9901]|eukprot:XP_001422328.1 predicted protein [Ostreococcus lucimarinus CCE9901]